MRRSIASIASLGVLALFSACGPNDPGAAPDAGADGGRIDAAPDAQLPSTAHCRYEPVPPTAGAGGRVTPGAISAGAAERLISIPVSATLGAFTARSSGFGGQGFVDARRPPLAGNFAGSVGIELWPRARAVAITTGAFSDSDPAGEATILFLKVDLGAVYQGHLRELEERLGPDFAGRIIYTANHSHSGLANFTGHTALQIGFGIFRRIAFEALLDDLEAVAREALANRRPARIGFAFDGEFDRANAVNRDRRGENDDLPGGDGDDDDLYVIRIDGADGRPIAVMPVFGIHGTILDADNVMASGDAPAGLERVLEDQFDEEVVVMHLQGAGGDVSPAGFEGPSGCDGREFCQPFARVESIGWYARDEVMAAWQAAGESMIDTTEIEAVTRTVPHGPDYRNFTIRDGTLEYAPFDGWRYPDLRIWADPETRLQLLSPIDEFNAPLGAALCGAALMIPGGRMPGAAMLDGTPYETCAMLNERVGRIFASVLDIELGEFPICDTTRATVSAARIGDRYFVTIPGEIVLPLRERMRAQMPGTVEQQIVLGYAQDHVGYVLSPEDWMRGGYEPNITFWGPLEGEAIAERALELLPLVMSPEREDASAGGVDRPAVPMVDDGIEPMPLPATFGAPDASPGYLLTTALPAVPPPQPPESVQRLDSVYFTWIGADPLWGTPTVTLERVTGPGSYEVVRRPSGRPVSDGHILLTWTPDPAFEYQLNPDTVHYWTAQWQAVNWQDALRRDEEPLRRLADRVGAPLGRYVLHVVGPPSEAGAPLYELRSEEFEVVPTTMMVRGSASGGTTQLEIRYQATPTGYRFLDPRLGAAQAFPKRGGTVRVSIAGGPAVEVPVDLEGRASVSGVGAMTITDEYGNTGTFAP